jgi:hypothetical protein
VTFGSVDRRLAASFSSAEPNREAQLATNSPEIPAEAERRGSGASPACRVRIPGRQLVRRVCDQGVDEVADVGEQVDP